MGSFFSSSNANAAPGHDDGDSAVVAVHTKDTWNAQWQSHMESSSLMVVDFSASWCGPCRFIEPAYKAMANKFADVVFLKIDVDELKDVSAKWKVQAMPTFVLVKGGQEVSRVVGAKTDELERKIQMFKK